MDNDRIEEIIKWVKDARDWYSRDPEESTNDLGRIIRFSKDELSDPLICAYVGIDDDLSKLACNIGKKCSVVIGSDNEDDIVISGEFLGISADFSDFYYVVKSDEDSVVHNCTAVCGIKFNEDDNKS